jgi:hypothetical protein
MDMPAEDFNRNPTSGGTSSQLGNGTHHANNRSMLELFTQLVDQMSLLFRKELELAKAEMSEKASAVGSGLIKMVLGAVLMIPALVILLQGIVAWLDRFGLEPRWGFLLVGVVAALVGYALLHSGMAVAKPANLTPRRTAHQLQRDADVAKEQVR